MLKSDLFEQWYPYWSWECFMNGMWDNRKNNQERILEARQTLADAARCREAMTEAIKAYPISARQHLSKVQTNRRPWLGQAACTWSCGATEEETRLAWNFVMTPEEQKSANAIADELIAAWSPDGN